MNIYLVVPSRVSYYDPYCYDCFRQIYLVVPSMTLLITNVITIDNCEWGKVHPKMFPDEFHAKNTQYADGWTLLNDNRATCSLITTEDLDAKPIIYWTPVTVTDDDGRRR